jgi:hypothetical protein
LLVPVDLGFAGIFKAAMAVVYTTEASVGLHSALRTPHSALV